MNVILSLCGRGTLAVLDWFHRHIKRWNELYLFAALMFWWPASQRVLEKLNPNAAPLPFDVLHKFYLACLVFAGARAFIYVGQWINEPHRHRYNEEKSATDFNDLTPWERQNLNSRDIYWQLACFSLIFLAAMFAG